MLYHWLTKPGSLARTAAAIHKFLFQHEQLDQKRILELASHAGQHFPVLNTTVDPKVDVAAATLRGFYRNHGVSVMQHLLGKRPGCHPLRNFSKMVFEARRPLKPPPAFLIGAMKSGTSALHAALVSHPRIHQAYRMRNQPDWLRKEMHFFNHVRSDEQARTRIGTCETTA